MVTRCLLRTALAPVVLVAIEACSGSGGGTNATQTAGGTASGSGGAAVGASSGYVTSGIGGATLVQSASSASGANGMGGASATGAVSSQGGTSTSTVSSLGGATTNGGAGNAGGATTNGGAGNAGGARSGGASSLGGMSTAGGSTGAAGARTGGATSTGGASAKGGATGTGGASTGTPICGTAVAAANATLTCPQGQIISSVDFASYGNPTGTCNSFAAGSCNSAASLTRVKSLCVGRNTCKVPASNNTFGDPCSGTTKSLSIQVSCVAGTPSIGATSPFKGLANSPAAEITNLGASWCYNWTTAPDPKNCADPLFVPMIWGGGSVASALSTIGNAGYKTVLGFNEPNKADQSNMTVAAAIALWPTLTSNPNIRVGSPAVSDDGRAWLEDFMTQANAGGLRVDFIAMHWYGWNAGSCTSGNLMGAVNWAAKWGLPVWVTEFGCMGSSNPDEATLLSFFNAAIPALANSAAVERYAFYPWNTYNDLYRPNASNVRMITALGTAFAAASKYK